MAIAVLLAAISLSGRDAKADSATYQFLSPELTGGPLECGGCGQSLPDQTVAIEFTVATLLTPNFSGYIDPTSWDFDASITGDINSEDSLPVSFFLMTDGSGQIIGWDMGVSSLINITTLGVPIGCTWCSGFTPGFSVNVSEGGPCNEFAGCSWSGFWAGSTAGQFTMTPEPSSFLLLGIGLIVAFGEFLRQNLKERWKLTDGPYRS